MPRLRQRTGAGVRDRPVRAVLTSMQSMRRSDQIPRGKNVPAMPQTQRARGREVDVPALRAARLPA
jgi:hypothetical protein